MAEIKKGMLIYDEVLPILGDYNWQAFISKDGKFANGEDWYYWKEHKILIRGPKDRPSRVGKVYRNVDITDTGSIPKELLNDEE